MQPFKIALATVIVLAILAGAIVMYVPSAQTAALVSTVSSLGMSSESKCDAELRNYARDTALPILIEWDDAVTLATNSSRMTLPPQIAALQAIRRNVKSEEASLCTLMLATSIETMMDAVINGFMAFLGNEDDIVVEAYFTGAKRMMDDVVRLLDEINSD